MAMKDTFNALVKRGVSEGTANLLLTKYNTLKSISDAGPAELVTLGISEEEADDVLTSIGKTSHRTTSKTKVLKKEIPDEEPEERMERVDKTHKITDAEQELIDICDKKHIHVLLNRPDSDTIRMDDLIIPLKVISEIAVRIKDEEGNDKEGVTQEKKEQLIVTAAEMCSKHRTCMNEPVGIVAAQSLGEPGTQMNMRTFHYAGVANINVTQGLPRLIEIVEAREASTPTMDIPLKSTVDEGIARHVSHTIEETLLNNVAEVITDITHMCLVVVPDMSKMNDRDISYDDVIGKLNSIKAFAGCVEMDDDGNIVISCKENTYQKLQDIYEVTKSAKIKGVPGITRAVLNKEEDGSWVIITEGSNLSGILSIADKDVANAIDMANIRTNNILEVATVFGIEAARNLIVKEVFGTLSNAGLDVDIRHVMLVADMMTNTGFVRPLNIYGIAGDKTSPLSRAAFERIGEFIEESAFMGLGERLGGVIENIIVGQPITLGTGAVNLIYTPNKKGDKKE